MSLFLFQSRAGIISVVDVLKVAEAFVNEDNYTVWSDLSVSLAGQSLLLQYTDGHDDFKRFVRDLYRQVYNTVGWIPKEAESMISIFCNGFEGK